MRSHHVVLAILMTIPVLCGACVPTKDPDGRFEPFQENKGTELVISEKTDPWVKRNPALGVTKAVWIGAERRDPREIPDQDPDYWMHGILTPSDDALGKLAEVATNRPHKLPALAPPLHEKVPHECNWRTVPPARWESVAGKAPSEFWIDAAVVSTECRLVLVVAGAR